MQSLVAKIHYTKRFLYNRIPVILQNTYLHSVCIYKKAWFIPEAMVSTQERWCSVRAVRTAPGCGWLWGVGVRWCAAGANVEETKSSHRQECASVLRRCVRGGSGAEEVVARPGPHAPLKAPSGFCSCCWWSGWSSAGRTSCLHHRPPGWGGLASVARWPPDPSSPSPSSKSGSHSPESLPFPPLDSSSSKREKKALMCLRSHCTSKMLKVCGPCLPYNLCFPASAVVASPGCGWFSPFCVSPSEVWRTRRRKVLVRNSLELSCLWCCRRWRILPSSLSDAGEPPRIKPSCWETRVSSRGSQNKLAHLSSRRRC